jgi:hypothetical protein
MEEIIFKILIIHNNFDKKVFKQKWRIKLALNSCLDSLKMYQQHSGSSLGQVLFLYVEPEVSKLNLIVFCDEAKAIQLYNWAIRFGTSAIHLFN